MTFHADDSHEMSSLINSGKYFQMFSAAVMTNALRVKRDNNGRLNFPDYSLSLSRQD